MSNEIEQAVDRMLEQDTRGDYYTVHAAGLRDAAYEKLLHDLDELGADYEVCEKMIRVTAPSNISKGHAILSLFRYNDLEVEGL